jgi:branched-chain amino acid aminotransferase
MPSPAPTRSSSPAPQRQCRAGIVRANERVAWFNGKFMPEREVLIPFRDSSWIYGDGCFDMTRSFRHRLFKLKEHVDRLYRSLKYLRIDPGFGPRQMCALTEDVFERNRHLLGADDDYWVGQRISRGVRQVDGDDLDHPGPNVVLECAPLPFSKRAKLFKHGIRVVIPSHRRVPPDSLTPRAKTHNYLNLIVADQEVQSIDPEAWAVLLDINGNLAEGLGSNIFIVRGDEILTPREKFVLPGVSRETVIELAPPGGPGSARDRHRPLRCLQCRRGFSHLDLIVHLSGDARERRRDRPERTGLGTRDTAPRRCLSAPGRLRLRRPISQPLRRRDGSARVLSAFRRGP